jgi:hypothetical protein
MSQVETGGRSSVDGGARPYLSVVVTARNDDHGGNLLGRMQIFVDAWVGQAKRHGLDCELILVEWNPPAERPRLTAALRWPSDTGPCRIRIVEVPPALHARYRHAAALALYQMIAKNAGIRRALGEFVLVTNIDVIFTDEVMAFLAQRSLEMNRMYRIDRHDAMADVPVDGTLDEQIAYCRSHILRLYAREGVFNLTEDGLRRNADPDITPADSGINFGAGWHAPELYEAGEGPFRWLGDDGELIARVPEGGGMLCLEVEPGPGVPIRPQPVQVVDEDGATVAEWAVSERETLEFLVLPRGTAPRRLLFRVPGAGLPVLDDPRIQNLRVFRCGWLQAGPAPAQPAAGMLQALVRYRPLVVRLLSQARRNPGAGPGLGAADLVGRSARLLASRGDDVFEAGLEYRVQGGVLDREESGGERFRWVDSEGRLLFRCGCDCGSVDLLVEPGPGVGLQPFDLEVRQGGAPEALRVPVGGLTLVRIPVRTGRADWVDLRLRAVGGGSPIGPDPRNLSFRIFAAGIAPGTGGARVLPDPCCRTVASTPRRLQWTTSEQDRRLVAAMGRPEFLHLFACGDFTLMARDHWFDLRGYPELDQFSMHLDSLLCYTAHHAGVREEMLREPMRIYHIEHGAGSGWTPEGHDALYARIARQGIPTISFQDLVDSITQMRILHAPIIFSMDRWGLAGVDLAETVPGDAQTAAEMGA